MKLTLSHLKHLCNRYVPLTSRHDGSLCHLGGPPPGQEWWYAHEIGHLLTVDHEQIGQPMFGMDATGLVEGAADEHELRCRELAAMSISRRLVTSVGRSDLVRKEEVGTDPETLCWNDHGRVRQIIKAHRCLRLPRTKLGLETKLRAAVATRNP